MTTVLTLWTDNNGTHEYEWLKASEDSGTLCLDLSKTKDKNNLKIYIANSENSKLELDMRLMLWIGLSDIKNKKNKL